MINNQEYSGANTVIEIETDSDEDQQIREHYMHIRLNRPEASSSQLLNSEEHNVAVRSSSASASLEQNIHNSDSDELEIVEEVMLNNNNELLAPNTPVLDLEDHPPTMNSIITYPGMTRFNDENIGNNDGDNADDDIIIVGERMALPTFILNLPGGQRLQINGNINDLPIRRSFQDHRNAIRTRMLRHTVQNAEQLFLDPHNEDDDDMLNRDHLPITVRSRQQREIRNRITHQLQRQRQSSRGVRYRDSEVENLNPEIRNIFYHSQSLYEFRSMIRTIQPSLGVQQVEELSNLFLRFRSRTVTNWGRERLRNYRNVVANNHNRTRTGISNINNITDLDGHSFTGMVMTRPFPFGLDVWRNSNMDEDIETQSIIEMIQAREEREQDCRKKKLMEGTKTQQNNFLNLAKSLPDGYSASFGIEAKISDNVEDKLQKEEIITKKHLDTEYQNIPVCCLCGVELGIGIPDDFQGITKQDFGTSFENLVSKYQTYCPYQSLVKPSIVDRDLSRRTYVALCGHTFCGRCFTRIDNARRTSKCSKKKLLQLKGPSHPDNYGPKICPAKGCKTQLRSKGRMREVFF